MDDVFYAAAERVATDARVMQRGRKAIEKGVERFDIARLLARYLDPSANYDRDDFFREVKYLEHAL